MAKILKQEDLISGPSFEDFVVMPQSEKEKKDRINDLQTNTEKADGKDLSDDHSGY